MAFFGDSDLAFLINDFGVPVEINGKKMKGLLDSADQVIESMSGGPSNTVGKAYVLTVPTTGLKVKTNDSITVDGKAYTVWMKIAIDDGALTQLKLGTGKASNGNDS